MKMIMVMQKRIKEKAFLVNFLVYEHLFLTLATDGEATYLNFHARG